jgi:hypothetical protein
VGLPSIVAYGCKLLLHPYATQPNVISGEAIAIYPSRNS